MNFSLPAHFVRALQAVRGKNDDRAYVSCFLIREDYLFATNGVAALYIPYRGGTALTDVLADNDNELLIDLAIRPAVPVSSHRLQFRSRVDNPDRLSVTPMTRDHTPFGTRTYQAQVIKKARFPNVNNIIPDRNEQASNRGICASSWDLVSKVYPKGVAVMHHTDDRIVFTPAKPEDYPREYPEGMRLFFMARWYEKSYDAPNYFRV